MKKNIVKEKSFGFAVMVVNLYKLLTTERKEFVLSKKILHSGTAVGAMYREAEQTESKADFIRKMAIAQKECNEAIYWFELLRQTDFLNEIEFESIYSDATEFIKLITSIIKTAKLNINN